MLCMSMLPLIDHDKHLFTEFLIRVCLFNKKPTHTSSGTRILMGVERTEHICKIITSWETSDVVGYLVPVVDQKNFVGGAKS